MESISKIPYQDRLQSILEKWFTKDWDRESPRPNSLVPYWWGYTYDADGKGRELTPEEQNKIDQELLTLFGEDHKNVFFYYFISCIFEIICKKPYHSHN